MDLSNFGKFPSLRGKTVVRDRRRLRHRRRHRREASSTRARASPSSISTRRRASALCDPLRAQYGAAPHFTRCDITDIAALQAIIDKVGRDLGDIGVLVNNAANDSATIGGR